MLFDLQQREIIRGGTRRDGVLGDKSCILDPSSDGRSGKSWGQLGGAASGEPMVSVR
jgi:hypothetical protein